MPSELPLSWRRGAPPCARRRTGASSHHSGAWGSGNPRHTSAGPTHIVAKAARPLGPSHCKASLVRPNAHSCTGLPSAGLHPHSQHSGLRTPGELLPQRWLPRGGTGSQGGRSELLVPVDVPRPTEASGWCRRRVCRAYWTGSSEAFCSWEAGSSSEVNLDLSFVSDREDQSILCT